MLNPNTFDSLKSFKKALFEEGLKQGWELTNSKISEIGKLAVDKILNKEGR